MSNGLIIFLTALYTYGAVFTTFYMFKRIVESDYIDATVVDWDEVVWGAALCTFGWWGLLLVFIVGVGAEVATAVATTPHGVPPRWWSWGLALWAYPVAWGTALMLSLRPVFGSGNGKVESDQVSLQ